MEATEEGLITNLYFYSDPEMGSQESSNVFPAAKLIFVVGGISVACLALYSAKNNLQFGAAAVWLKPG